MKAGDSLKISKSFDNACAYSGLTDELGHCGDHKAHQVSGGVTLAGQYDFGNGFTMGAGILVLILRFLQKRTKVTMV